MSKEQIMNNKELKILNLDALAKGTGARFLECIRSHNGELIAKQWRKKEPSDYQVLVRFE